MLKPLNPTLPAVALTPAETELTRDRSAMLPVAANRDVHRLLIDGVTVEVRRDDGAFETLRVRVTDRLNPAANDFLAASQMWIDGLPHRRRPDTIGLVNGLPPWIAEWKGPTQALAEGHEKNLEDDKDTIPARTFAAVGALTKQIDQAQANSRAHLRELPAGAEPTPFLSEPACHPESHMKRYLLAIAMAIHTSAASAAAFHVFGAGVDSCGSYLNYRQIPDAEAVTMSTLAWLEGYLTAYNKYVAKGGDVLAGKFDLGSLQAWLDTYCKANPSDDIVTATKTFIDELKTRKR